MARRIRRKMPLALLFLLLLGLARPVQAAPASYQVEECNPFNPDGTIQNTSECQCSDNVDQLNYCMPATEYLRVSLGQMLAIALFSGAEKFAGLLWFSEKAAVVLANYALEGQLWTQIRESILTLLANIMGGSGGVLDLIIRGPNGLFYLALILAGLILIIPFAVFGQRPVKLERVFLWGVFIIALFVGSTQGFDLIGALENLRVALMQTILSGETVELSDLVAAPMSATSTEATTFVDTAPLVLPATFDNQYFPDPAEAEGWHFRVLVASALNNLIDVVFPATLIEDEALQEMGVQAIAGIILALLTLVPAFVLLLVAVILMLLTAASLVLILFFVAAIPLGFFEFGATILGNIAKQYGGIVVISLFAAIFVRILAALGVGIFGNDFGIAGMIVYIAGLGLVIIALQAGVKQAWKALDGSLGLMQTAFVSVGSLAFTSGPLKGTVDTASTSLNSAVSTAAALGMGALTGGSSLLATAFGGILAAGNLPGSSTNGNHPQVGNAPNPPPSDLQTLAPAFSTAAASATFGTSTQAKISQPTPSSPNPAQTHSSVTPHQPPGTLNPIGTYVTPDLTLLEQAEHAYFDVGDEIAAHHHLAQGLGSASLAGAVMEAYKNGTSAEEVYKAVQVTQETAARNGLPVMDGHLTQQFIADLRAALLATGLNLDDPLTSHLAQASIRQLSPADALSDGAELLAYSIAEPDDPLVLVTDSAAQFRLYDLAEKLEWDTGKLKRLFEQYRQALQEANRKGQSVQETLAGRLQTDPVFAQEREHTRNEAARLAVLVAGQAWVQLPLEAKPTAKGKTP